MSSSNPNVLPGYNLPPPTEEVALRALSRVFGEAQARPLWASVCQAAGFPRPGPALSPQQLRSVAEQLERYPGYVSILGAALRIRVDAFLHPSRRSGAADRKSVV